MEIALIISFAALLSTSGLLYVTIKHNKLSLKPHLVFRLTTNRTEAYVRLFFCNKGLGPAIFEEFFFKYGDLKSSEISIIMRQILMDLGLSEEDFIKKEYVYPLKTYAIHIKEDKDLLYYYLKNESRIHAENIFEKLKDVEIHYMYIDYYNVRKKKVFTYRSITDHKELYMQFPTLEDLTNLQTHSEGKFDCLRVEKVTKEYWSRNGMW